MVVHHPVGTPRSSRWGVNGINFSGTATADGVQHYADTCTERYGNRETWADAQMERFDAWGINTAGGWSEWGLYKNRLPFTVTLGLAGSDWLTGTVVDYFHPDWEPAVRARLEAGTAGNTENPYLIGYFLDNELHWSHDHRGGDLLSGYMAMSADSAGKTHLLAFLLERYGTIASLNVDFSTNAASWEELAGKTKLTPRRDEDYHPLPDTVGNHQPMDEDRCRAVFQRHEHPAQRAGPQPFESRRPFRQPALCQRGCRSGGSSR